MRADPQRGRSGLARRRAGQCSPPPCRALAVWAALLVVLPGCGQQAEPTRAGAGGGSAPSPMEPAPTPAGEQALTPAPAQPDPPLQSPPEAPGQTETEPRTSSAPEAQAQPEQQPTEPPRILAWVGEDPITRAQLDQALERVDTGPARLSAADQADLERRLLLSLIDARALALLAEQEIAPDDLQAIDLRAAAYREELLVQRYLSAHANPAPVSWQMVQDYYQDHPNEFGAEREVTFDLVRTLRPVQGPERDAAINALAGLDAVQDWRAWMQEQDGGLFDFRSSTARPGMLEQPLRGLLERTEAGTTSAISHGELLQRVRVTAVQEIPPRPLDEVAAEIRRRLAPMQLRDVIGALAEQATTTLGVRYPGDAPPPTIPAPDSADATLNQANGATAPAHPDPQ